MPEAGLFAAFGLWSLLSFAFLYLQLGDGSLSVADGDFNGSDGLAFTDHMQYLAWIRDAGEHVLFSNRFDVVDDPHLFLHPMALVSGLLWKAGVSLEVAFLIWKPVVVVVLFAGFAAYTRRMLEGRARLVALGLALFLVSPAVPLVKWLDVGDDVLQFSTYLVGFELFPAQYTWGAFGGGVAIGLTPLVLLAVERLLDPERRAPGRSARWYSLWAGGAGLLMTWLHPWQGLVLLAMLGGLVVWDRFDRRHLALLAPGALTAAPLVYYFALARTDSAWEHVSEPLGQPHLGWWLILALGPPMLLALPGVPGRALDTQERLLRLWPVAAVAVYLVLQRSFFFHALAGLSLPLVVLAVRGWPRLRLPAPVAVAGVLAFTVPGMVYAADTLADSSDAHFFDPGEARALDYLEHSPRPGPVLAPGELGQAVPAFGDRNTWVGHYTWTPGYAERRRLADDLFAGRLTPQRARAVVRTSRAAFVVSDCVSSERVRSQLAPLLAGVRRFGCATVYEVRGA